MVPDRVAWPISQLAKFLIIMDLCSTCFYLWMVIAHYKSSFIFTREVNEGILKFQIDSALKPTGPYP